MWDVERLLPIVEEWDAALRAEVPTYAPLVPAAKARGSVLRPPASEAQVCEAEARLGTRLPPSYRSFLLISDGADAGPSWAARVQPGHEPDVDHLLTCDELLPAGEDDGVAYLLDIWSDASPGSSSGPPPYPGDDPVSVADPALGRDAVSITFPVQNGIVGLVPGEPEWQAWEFMHAEIIAHRSFADLLRQEAKFARMRVAQQAERVRTADPATGLVSVLGDLAALGDPRAVAAGSRAVVDLSLSESQRQEAASILGAIGDPEAIPALREAYERRPGPRTITPFRGLTPAREDTAPGLFALVVLEALEQCGDPAALGALERLAATSTAWAGSAASYLARRSRD